MVTQPRSSIVHNSGIANKGRLPATKMYAARCTRKALYGNSVYYLHSCGRTQLP